MRGGCGEEVLEFKEHEARVVVDVAPDGEDWDAPVVGSESFHVWAREVGWLEL